MTVEEERDFYRAILDSMQDAVLVKDGKSRILWANQTFCGWYGMDVAALRGLTDREEVDPDFTLQYVRDDHQVFTTGVPLDIPAEPITLATGEEIFVHSVKTPYLAPDGEIAGTVGVSRLVEPELVERGRLPSVLKGTTEDLRSLVRDLPSPAAMLDVKQRIVSASSEWHSTFSGRPEFYSPAIEARLPLQSLMELVVVDGQKLTLSDQKVERENGEIESHDVDLIPWFLPNQAIGGCMVMLTDMTEVRRSQASEVRLNEELSAFNYRVSHDLIAPIRSSLGLLNIADILLARKSLEEVAGLHLEMRTQLEKLTRVADKVAAVIRADRANEASQPLCISDIVQDIVGYLGSAAEAVDLEVHAPRLRVELPVNRVRHILRGLISNAVSFADPANPKVTVRGTVGETGLALTVEDNGAGVGSEVVNSLFGIFARGAHPRAGSGLGLYIVRKHVAALGGTIELVSAQSPTRFEVRLPTEERK